MGKRHALVLWILLAAFCFRVLAQLIAAIVPIRFLPPFEAWHSATLPYPALVASQCVIIAVYSWMARRIDNSTPPRKKLGKFFVIFGSVYFFGMVSRLILGLTWLHDRSWFNAPIPSLFHLVLAAFLLVAGHYHLQKRT